MLTQRARKGLYIACQPVKPMGIPNRDLGSRNRAFALINRVFMAGALLFSLLHVLPDEVDFAVGFVHVLLDLGDGGEEL